VASQASQDQVRTFVASLQQDNLQLMKDYMQLSAKDQKVYVESLLVDFSKYLQEQRKQDLMLFQTRMSSIEKNTDQFKQETEQILANIIANPEGALKRVNNY
jgi:23S rRNA maturation-related 3'-5' exoribonuclease YhaM